MKTPWRTVAIACSLTLGACASGPGPGCRGHERAALQDSVYFGTGMPDDGVVTADQWAGFLATIVTPRFPQGLTVSTVSGQWRGADGAIVQERTYVLGLVHPDDVASEEAIGDIIAAYKTRFRQEAVLRVRAGVCIAL